MNASRFALLETLAFTTLALAAIMMPLLPLGHQAERLVMPDFLLALAAAWCVRRPQSMPLVLTAGLLLLSDFVLDRPVGLWALISLLAIEALRAQRATARNRPFAVEWSRFAVALGIGLIAQSLILSLALVPHPGASVHMQLFAVTVAVYPVVAAGLHYVLRVRAPRPAERSSRLGRVA